jgi:hypothetical protein
MKQSKLSLSLFVASLASIVVLAAAPVAYASHGSDDGSDDSTSTSQQTDDQSGDTSQEDQATEVDDNGGANETEVHHQALLFRQMGMEKMQQARENHSTLKAAKRQKVCEHIQNAVNHKLKAFDNHASTYLTRLNSVFTKLQAYQTKNNLPVSNYTDLVSAATTAQNNATVSVDALNSLGSTLDCSSSDPGAMLSGVKEGAASARDALKAYRTSLKNIVVALAHAQSDSSNSTSTEDN